MDIASNTSRSIALLIFIYCLNWGLLLVNFYGVYWDDRVLVGQTFNTLNELFISAGFPLLGGFHYILLDIGIFSYRVLCFVAHLVVVICSFLLLNRCRRVFSSQDAFLIAVLIACIPLNQARVALITLPYQVCLAMFMLAWSIVVINFHSRKSTYYILALALFFVSFITASLLVFYAVFAFYVLLLEAERVKGDLNIMGLVRNSLKEYWIFWILPIVYWAFKSTYFIPSGVYTNYNKFNFERFTTIFGQIHIKFYETLIRLFDRALSLDNLVFLFLLLGFFTWTFNFLVRKDKTRLSSCFLLLFIGLSVYLIGVFPYLLVGKVPGIENWASRHELLLGFGFSIVIYGIISLVRHRFVVTFLLAAVVSLFTIQNISDSYYFHYTAVKHDAMVYFIKKNNEQLNISQTGGILKFLDKTRGNHDLDWRYRFYEFSGLLKEANGHSKVFGADSTLSDKRNAGMIKRFKELPQYNFNQIGNKPKVLPVVMVIDKKMNELDIGEKFNLVICSMVSECRNKHDFLTRYFDIRFKPQSSIENTK